MSRYKELKRKASFIKRRGVRGLLEAAGLRARKDDSIAGLASILQGSQHAKVSHAPASLLDDGRLIVNWYISEPPLASWRYEDLFSLISRLESSSIANVVCLYGSKRFRNDANGFLTFLRDRYPVLGEGCKVVSDSDEAPLADVAVATDWKTAYEVERLSYPRSRYYYLGCCESMKHPAGSLRCFVERTYDMGLKGIVVSPYVEDWISKRHDMSVVRLPFGFTRECDRGMKREDAVPRVAFHVDREDSMSNYILGMMAISHLCNLVHEVEVIYLGDEMKSMSSPTPRCYDLGGLNSYEVRACLNQCDCLLYLSVDTPTNLPLEAMSCGVVPVVLEGANNSWLLPEDACVFVGKDPRAIADSISELIRSKEVMEEKREAAIAFADGFSWEPTVARLSEHLLEQRHDQ